MPARPLYVAAYDVADHRRRRRVLRALRAFALDGQQSAYECPLDRDGRQALLAAVRPLLDSEEDRFVLVRVNERAPVRRLGRGAERAAILGAGLIVVG